MYACIYSPALPIKKCHDQKGDPEKLCKDTNKKGPGFTTRLPGRQCGRKIDPTQSKSKQNNNKQKRTFSKCLTMSKQHLNLHTKHIIIKTSAGKNICQGLICCTTFLSNKNKSH